MDFKKHFMDKWTTISSPTEMVKKIEDFEDVRKAIKPKLSATQTLGGNKGPFKSRYENFSKKMKHPSHLKYSDKWDDYRHQKDHRQREDARQRDRFQNKNQDNSFDKRYRSRCSECGSCEHFQPQCPRLKSNEKINCISSNDDLLETYTIRRLVNGLEMPILRETGATVDVISQKFVDYAKMTGEHIWVKYLLNDHLLCLPLAKVEIKCKLGHIKTKEAVVTNDPSRYVLGNKTANLFEDKPFLKLEKINAVMTRSQAKRSSEEDQNKEAEVEQPEDMTHFEIDEAILPQADEEYKEIKQLVEVDSKEFLESQHQRRGLAPLLNEAKTENSCKPNDFKIKENGMLVKKKIDKNENERELIVLPEKFRDQIKSLYHYSTSGHLGIVKTKDRLARYFYWPNCYKEIEEYVKTCEPCQRVGKYYKTEAPLTSVPIISEVFSKINFDPFGPLPTTPNGNRYLITAICLASKYPDALPVPNIGSTPIIEAMIQIFSRMGFPKEMQTDQGTSFTSNLAIEFPEKLGIKVTSSVHHPQSNPVERFHRTIKRILKVLCIEAASEWERQVPAALFALRTIRHEGTGFTPSELVYGRNLRTPVTLIYEQWMNPGDEGNIVVEYVYQLIDRLKRCKELALVKMLEMQTERKVYYDRKAIKREFSE
ncbi:Retrovirus-related Pol polyprotein from transposon 412 [Araneus ventricosus]|uniref:RNA-directed DNA polymerase n=1 Tax=Araneus ventricosus TaxID=182803 RepID=A0A4Y2RCJ6_ARAVE|nr:Retrovirus-related Pol polyprotein from transposon 412 [Araneus ventricosus]